MSLSGIVKSKQTNKQNLKKMSKLVTPVSSFTHPNETAEPLIGYSGNVETKPSQKKYQTSFMHTQKRMIMIYQS